MARMTLDDIRSSLEKKYSSFELDLGTGNIDLRNPLRLSKEDRAALSVLFKDGDLEGDDADEKAQEKFSKVLEIAATPETKANVRKFLRDSKDDEDLLLTLVEVVEAYFTDQQVGEA